jgi:hypothetical protein
MYHTSNTAAARKRTRDNGASQRLPSPLRGTSLTPPSSTVSVMRHPEAQLELAEAIGAGDRATAPFAARTDPRGVRWPAPPARQKKPAVPKPEGQCHWSRPGPKDVNAAISDAPPGRAKRRDANPPIGALSAQSERPGALGSSFKTERVEFESRVPG